MNLDFLLFRKSMRTSWKRLMLVMGATAVGITILLLFTAYYNAMTDTKHTNFSYYTIGNDSGKELRQKIAGIDPVYIDRIGDKIDGKYYSITLMQKTGLHAPKLPGGVAVPNAGEYLVSPALKKLMDEKPELKIADRFSGRLVGTLPEDIIAYRSTNMVIAGSNDIEKLYRNESDTNWRDALANNAYYSFDTTKIGADRSFASKTIQSVVYTGIIILILPIIMLVSIATKLGSVQREQRYASLRLIGFTNRRITRMMMLETLMATIAGIGLGSLLYFALWPLLLDFTLSGELFWPSAVQVLAWQWIAIIAITIGLSLLANVWGMRHVITSPLGVTRRQKVEKKPGWWRLLPMLIVVGLLVFIQTTMPKDADQPAEYERQMMYINLFMMDIVLMMMALVYVAPWLTYMLSKLVAKFSRRPATILATKYINVHARAVTRSVVGVILALFAGSFYIIGTSGVTALKAQLVNSEQFYHLRDNVALVYRLNPDTAGKISLGLSKRDGGLRSVDSYDRIKATDEYIFGRCAVIDKYFDNIDCRNGQLIAISTTSTENDGAKTLIYGASDQDLSKKVVADAKLRNYYNANKVLDGVVDAYLIEHKAGQGEAVRSAVVANSGGAFNQDRQVHSEVVLAAEAKRSEIDATIKGLAQLAYGGMGVTLVVAIISIVVSTIGGLLERRRSLYSLRLSGVYASELRSMVMIESVIPLIFMSVMSVGFGAWMACVFIDVTGGSEKLSASFTPEFFATIIGAMILAAVVIYMVLPLLNKLTRPDANQTE